MTTDLFAPLTLPNGQTLPNRIAKAAMEEALAAQGQVPGDYLFQLYKTWSAGGTGLLITGNVMVHNAAMTGPSDIILDKTTPLESFRRWAEAAHSGGAKAWMQINHPGRQVQANMPGVAWGPSASRVDTGRTSRLFANAEEMTPAQIEQTIQRFVDTAVRAEQVGFDGVEVHAAHGYLLSQFLSPLVNKRTDEWGGSLANRAKLLLEIVRRIRDEVQPEFAVAVKLNSADFQRGGFEPDDARQVIEWLAPLGVDLVELSGGSYESPAMAGNAKEDDHRSARTAEREAYFLELAEQLVADSPLPLMMTGGVKRRSTAQTVLDTGVSVVGMGTALAMDPDLPNKWKAGNEAAVELSRVGIKDKAIASQVSNSRVNHQMRRIGRGKAPNPKFPALAAAAIEQIRAIGARRRYARWLAARS